MARDPRWPELSWLRASSPRTAYVDNGLHSNISSLPAPPALTVPISDPDFKAVEIIYNATNASLPTLDINETFTVVAQNHPERDIAQLGWHGLNYPGRRARHVGMRDEDVVVDLETVNSQGEEVLA
ncbi:hypothetical protein DFP72DRAFT_1065216 [Ephemerocybe angulata]|uniref:Uncharacterized protein n=1 Tax=Ephemerocybe angulata TaxID=980116 RepID=A0A8H6I4W4_9AGAR|nr:hypothetical protein DFP72DRAFT_1065216 [Tulosesus angulatus]